MDITTKFKNDYLKRKRGGLLFHRLVSVLKKCKKEKEKSKNRKKKILWKNYKFFLLFGFFMKKL